MTENQLSTAAPVGGETEHQPQPHEAPGQPGTSETASRPVDPPSTADTESDSADVPRSSAEQAYTDSRFQPMNPRMAELPLGGPFAQQPDSSVLQTADKNEDHTPSDHAKVSRPANELSDVERHSKGTKRQLEELRENMQRQLVSRAQIPAPSSSRQATRNPRHVDLMEDVFSASQRQQEEPSNSPSPVSPYNEDVLERNMIMSLLDIVHRFLDAIQDAQEIFEENDAAHYASYERLRKKHETIQNFWRCFVAESTITFTRRSLDELQLLCNDIEHVYTNMVTPRPASSRYANIMADCRARAKWVAEEARALQQILAEYIVAKEEIGVPRAPGPNDSEPKDQECTQSDHSLAETTQTAITASVTSPKVVNPSANVDITTPNDEKNKTTSTSVGASGPPSMKSDMDSEPVEDQEACFHQRDPKLLDKNLFDPVWIPGDKNLPGDFPEELRQLVGLGEGLQIAGSPRSLFWLAGMDDAIDIIDDPTTKLEDHFEAVPLGTSIAGFLTNRYVEEQLLPESFHQRLLGFVYDAPRPRTFHVPPARIPDGVTERPTTVNIHSLYPWHRRQCFPEWCKVQKIKHEKDELTWVSKAMRDDSFFTGRKSLLFRGVSLQGLEQSLSFFMPVYNGVNHTNEFGPAIYATPSIAYAKRYAGMHGAILVFNSPDSKNMVTWVPDMDDWKLLVAHHLGIKHRPQVPPQFDSVDVIIGPVSRRLRMGSEGDLEQSDERQHAYASYNSRAKLASSLEGIIYVS